MSAKRLSIAQVMVIVALAAVNLAIARATPSEVVSFPSIWIVLGIFDFLIVWKLILRHSLRAFHYTFLVVLFVGFFVMANLVATERFRPLGLMIRLYQHVSGEQTNRIARGAFRHGPEFWLVAFLSLALAGAVGWFAAWLERRRGWDIAALWRGALLGLCIATLLATIDDKVHGWAVPERYSIRWISRAFLLAVCLTLGGPIGLWKLRSRPLVPNARAE